MKRLRRKEPPLEEDGNRKSLEASTTDFNFGGDELGFQLSGALQDKGLSEISWDRSEGRDRSETTRDSSSGRNDPFKDNGSDVTSGGRRIDLSSIPYPVTTRNASGEKIEPLRPLSAYNYFFRDERERVVNPEAAPPLEFSQERAERLLLDHWNQDRTKKRSHRKTHGKISFTDLSKLVSRRWKELSDEGRAFFQTIATADFKRFQAEGGTHPTKKQA